MLKLVGFKPALNLDRFLFEHKEGTAHEEHPQKWLDLRCTLGADHTLLVQTETSQKGFAWLESQLVLTQLQLRVFLYLVEDTQSQVSILLLLLKLRLEFLLRICVSENMFAHFRQELEPGGLVFLSIALLVWDVQIATWYIKLLAGDESAAMLARDHYGWVLGLQVCSLIHIHHSHRQDGLLWLYWN